jgi:hypothetical protein
MLQFKEFIYVYLVLTSEYSLVIIFSSLAKVDWLIVCTKTEKRIRTTYNLCFKIYLYYNEIQRPLGSIRTKGGFRIQGHVLVTKSQTYLHIFISFFLENKVLILISDAVISVVLVRTSGESTQQLKLKAKIDDI